VEKPHHRRSNHNHGRPISPCAAQCCAIKKTPRWLPALHKPLGCW
jgi:hypothetical protein